MAKKEYSFADEAQKIMKRFPRKETDPIEKRDYEDAMNRLMAEQEAVRESMGLTQPQEGMPQEQFKCGGKMKYQTGGFVPTDYISPLKTPIIGDNLSYNMMDTIPGKALRNESLQAAKDWASTQIEGIPEEQSFWDKNKQYAPYALSGLSNIASNLLLANMAKRNQPRISAAISTPERINLEPQAEALRGQAGVAKSIAARNARNLGLNPVQAMATMSAAGTDIDRNLGDVLTSLYMQQEGANVGAANQFALANQAAENRARAMNIGLDQQALENRLGYTGAALGTIPGVMKDIRMDKADQDMRDVMRSYYKSMGRNYMVEGDIFEKDGFRYKVRNNKLEKVGKVK